MWLQGLRNFRRMHRHAEFNLHRNLRFISCYLRSKNDHAPFVFQTTFTYFNESTKCHRLSICAHTEAVIARSNVHWNANSRIHIRNSTTAANPHRLLLPQMGTTVVASCQKAPGRIKRNARNRAAVPSQSRHTSCCCVVVC